MFLFTCKSVFLSITNITQNHTFPENPIYISGSGFGSAPGAVSLARELIGPVLTWNDTLIVVIGPGVIKKGPFYVVNAFGDTNNATTLSVLKNVSGIHLSISFHYSLIFKLNLFKFIYTAQTLPYRCYAWSALHVVQYSTNKFNIDIRGEYVLMRENENGNGNGNATVQIRLEACGPEFSSCITAVCSEVEEGEEGKRVWKVFKKIQDVVPLLLICIRWPRK
jgi:hypothetical protein